VGVWKSPVAMDPPAWVIDELKKPRDYTADLKKLLASANICDKRWVFEQYDSMVQSNTVQGPGGEAGVMRIKQGTVTPTSQDRSSGTPTGNREQGTEKKPERGLAMALAGNGRWCWLDPKLGAMHAVAEAARKVACTGATPVAATNCLNFGNPEKPEIMAQFSATVDGIAEACTALGTPITGGNVSFYNETRGEGIYPTPVVGIVGILEDVGKAVPSGFQRAGDLVILLTLPAATSGTRPDREFGSTEFAKTILQTQWGTPPCMQLLEEFELHNALQALAKRGLIHSACDVSDGGLAVALAKACIPNNIGVHASIWPGLVFDRTVRELFGEDSSLAIISCAPEDVAKVKEVVDEFGFVFPYELGQTMNSAAEVGSSDFVFSISGVGMVIQTTVAELRTSYSSTLESQLAAEVVTA
jgi:phosphoribosylformylglycinamidine synthase